MTAPLSPEKLNEIKARCEKMPPETWEYEKNGDRKQVWAYSRLGYKNYLICQYDAPNAWEYTPDFIAHSRQDIPSLVAEVERQVAEIERLKDTLGEITRLTEERIRLAPDIARRVLAGEERG